MFKISYDFFREQVIARDRFWHCQEQPQLNSIQLQLKLMLRLALFQATQPPTHDSSFWERNTYDFFKITLGLLQHCFSTI